MKISELIAALAEIGKSHGDIKVIISVAHADSSPSFREPEFVEVEKHDSGGVEVQIRDWAY